MSELQIYTSHQHLAPLRHSLGQPPSSPMAVGARPIALSLALFSILLRATFSDEASEAAILVQFKSTIKDPSGSLQSWNPNSGGPCVKPNIWKGVICDPPTGEVFGLQLENMGLSGELNLDPLTQLELIRTLSFMNNSFAGPMPNVKQFKGLKNVYFSMNNLSGDIPDDAFDGMQSLKKLNLSRNGFTGNIPSSLVQVSSLLEVWAEDNGFVGQIPNFQQPGLKVVNVSNNNLEGKIPDGLSKMDSSMFAGEPHKIFIISSLLYSSPLSSFSVNL